MSRMIPRETIDAMRQAHDVYVDLYGIDVNVYVANNMNNVDRGSIYNLNVKEQYNSAFESRAVIEWSPTSKRLHQLGIFAEGKTPIIAWFKYFKEENEVLDIPVKSYISVLTEYIPDQYDIDEFEIVDIVIGQMHDAVIKKGYQLAPRRQKKFGS